MRETLNYSFSESEFLHIFSVSFYEPPMSIYDNGKCNADNVTFGNIKNSANNFKCFLASIHQSVRSTLYAKLFHQMNNDLSLLRVQSTNQIVHRLHMNSFTCVFMHWLIAIQWDFWSNYNEYNELQINFQMNVFFPLPNVYLCILIFILY